MAIAIPAFLYRWATGSGALRNPPSSSRQDSGWVVEEPDADTWNEVQNNVYNWLNYLKDLYNQTITWTGPITFNQLVTFVGNAIVNGTLTVNQLTATVLNLTQGVVTGNFQIDGLLQLINDPQLPGRPTQAIGSGSYNTHWSGGSPQPYLYSLPGGEVQLRGIAHCDSSVPASNPPSGGNFAFGLPVSGGPGGGGHWAPAHDVIIPVESSLVSAGAAPNRTRCHVTTTGAVYLEVLLLNGTGDVAPGAAIDFYLDSVRWNVGV